MVERIFIATYKRDFWLAEICCSSIRYWYPHIPISIVYDYSKGAVSFDKLKRRFQVELLELPIKKFGWGLSKIEALFLDKKEKVLVLDADTVLIGPVLDYLNCFEEPFIVSADLHNEPYAKWMRECYFDYKKLQLVDPSFEFPGYSFNTGQFVATTGILKRQDFEKLIEWKEFPLIKHPDIFACVDQGILNYVLPELEQKGLIKIGKADFLLGIRYPKVTNLTIEQLQSREIKEPKVLHWAGSNTLMLRYMLRKDILQFYLRQYATSSEKATFWLKELQRYTSFQQTRVVNKLKRIRLAK